MEYRIDAGIAQRIRGDKAKHVFYGVSDLSAPLSVADAGFHDDPKAYAEANRLYFLEVDADGRVDVEWIPYDDIDLSALRKARQVGGDQKAVAEAIQAAMEMDLAMNSEDENELLEKCGI